MHSSRVEFRRHEYVLHDETKRCLTAYLPDSLAHLVRCLAESENAYLLGLSERQLIKEMSLVKKAPDPRDYLLRLRFWFEFERVSNESGDRPLSMHIALVLGKLIPKESFYKYYATDPLKLAFILCPPQDYAIAIEASLNRLTSALLTYIEKLDITDDNVLKATKLLETLHQKHYGTKRRRKGVGPEDVVPVGDEETPAAQTEESAEEKLAKLKAARGELGADE